MRYKYAKSTEIMTSNTDHVDCFFYIKGPFNSKNRNLSEFSAKVFKQCHLLEQAVDNHVVQKECS